MWHISCRDGHAAERQEPTIEMSGKTARSVGAPSYDSIMCSTSEQRLAEIGRAIDDLAAQAVAATSHAAPERGQASEDADQVIQRLAVLWAKLAQLDPEVAKRLPTYEA
jgi:hypothetical protein